MIKYKSNYCFNNKNGSYLYNSTLNKIYKVPDSVLLTVDGMSKGYDKETLYNYLKSDINATTVYEIEKMINDINSENPIYEKYNSNITAVTILVVQACNFKCTYCFGDSGEYLDKGIMDLETGKKTIDFLVENSKEEKELFITFFGGEPLLNYKLIQQLVQYAHTREQKTNKQFNFGITTNGSLINKDVKNFFVDNKFGVQISIDGNKQSNDYNRFLANGKSAHNKIVNKSLYLIEDAPVSARATITDHSLNITENFNFLYGLGFSSIAFAPAYNMINNEHIEILVDEQVKYFLKFKTYLLDNNLSKCFAMRNVIKFLKLIDNSFPRSHYCSAGKKSIAVDINGNIYPCHRFVSYKNFCMGNVSNKLVSQFDFSVQSIGRCENCISKSVCAGACPEESLRANNNYLIPMETHCNMMRKITEVALDIYTCLDDKEKKYLKISK